MVGVILLQNVRDGNAPGGKSSAAFPVAVAARRIRGAVRSVRTEGKHGGVPKTGNLLGGGKGNLLIAAAQTGTGQMDNRFTPCYEGQRLFTGLVILSDGRKEAARIPGGTPQTVRQHHGRIAGVRCR